MSKTMQLIAADSTMITINRPAWGYSVDIHLPIYVADRHPAGYAFFDADGTGALDYRVLSTAKLQLPESQKTALNAFLRSASLGRAETITLRLGSSPTGFFPFGPDLGDIGDFSVRLITRAQGGMLIAPLRYWQDNFSLALVPPAPSYSAPNGTAQGKLQIGTVTGLLYPQSAFAPTSIYNFRTDLSRSGAPTSVDGMEGADSWECQWNQQCNTGNAASLISFLRGSSGRAGDISVLGATNFWVFGNDQGSDGEYLTKLLGSSKTSNEVIISITHEKHNQFTIPLNFWMVSKS